MDRLYFDGEMIYKDGWFVYTPDKDEVCVLTRTDARMVEDAYYAYQQYDASVTGMQRIVEGVRPFREYGISKKCPSVGNYKVDQLAPASSDAVIGDVLVIPEKLGDYTINTVLENSFQRLKISKVVLPATINKVCRGAFEHCDSLTQVVFNDSSIDISDAFENCDNIKYKEGFLRLGNTIIKAAPTLSGNIVIPEGVERIMPGAFESNGNITSVSLPKSIRSIGAKSFRCCFHLAQVSFPDSVESLTLGEYIFASCSALNHLKLPEGLTTIPEKAFCLCSSLTDLTIPSTVTKIRKWAFDRSKIEKDFDASPDYCLYVDKWLIHIKKDPTDELVVKDGTVGIADWAPGRPRCRGSEIGSLKLPPSVKYLGYGSLSTAAHTALDLGNVEYIGHLALEAIPLETIHIPATCRYFGIENFAHNTRWQDVYFHNPDTVMDASMRSFGSKTPVRVHGYAGSTAQKLCEELGEKYSLTFVPMKK